MMRPFQHSRFEADVSTRHFPDHVVIKKVINGSHWPPFPTQKCCFGVGGSGLEPLTSCVSSKYSNQLS